jgi:diacylglycerol kinase
MNLAILQWTRVSAADWYQVKLFIEHATGFSMDALHVIVGVLLQLAFAFLFKSSVARALPLLSVLALELVNEASDFRVEIWPQPGMQFGESAKDVILTMVLPTLIFLVARYRPKLLAQRPS